VTLATREEAVRWFRAQPNNERAVCDNYFDLPVRQAAERYAEGEEFAEVLRLLGSGNGRSIMDLGAGNGIASFALAKNGWQVTALEPDPSEEVGAGAIRTLVEETGLMISLVQECGEKLPFPDGAFDAVHARQVFHHAACLESMAREAARVLRSGGALLATREHVADDEEQLEAFRAGHPLHRLYGGESAYSLAKYLAAFESAGLRVLKVWGPLESILNFYPGTEAARQAVLCSIVMRRWFGLGCLLAWSQRFRTRQIQRVTRRDRTPGRIFSFLLAKP
jgi:SAM-dependent methyltransferase